MAEFSASDGIAKKATRFGVSAPGVTNSMRGLLL